MHPRTRDGGDTGVPPTHPSPRPAPVLQRERGLGSSNPAITPSANEEESRPARVRAKRPWPVGRTQLAHPPRSAPARSPAGCHRGNPRGIAPTPGSASPPWERPGRTPSSTAMPTRATRTRPGATAQLRGRSGDGPCWVGRGAHAATAARSPGKVSAETGLSSPAPPGAGCAAKQRTESFQRP